MMKTCLKPHKHNFNLALFIFMGLYLLFTIADISTSRQTGFRGADRSRAHYYLMILSGYLAIYAVIFGKKRIVLRQPFVSLLLLAVWTTTVNLMNSGFSSSTLVQANMSLLWIMSNSFFHNIRSKENSDTVIHTFSAFLLIFYGFFTVYYCFDMMSRLSRISVLNIIYYVLALVPWFCISCSEKQKKWVLLISMILTLISMKRGAIIAIPLMILADAFVDSKLKGSTKGFFKIFAYITILFVLIVVADKLSNGFVSQRFSTDDLLSGSGRDNQYKTVITIVKNRGLLELLVGRGSEYSLNVFGTGIHSDWFNFLFSYGIVGMLLFLSLTVSFVKKAIYSFRHIPQIASPCCMMTIFFLILSLISTSYSTYAGFWIFGFWGYYDTEVNKRMSKINNNEDCP